MEISRLKSIPLFSEFTDDELRAVAAFAAETSVGEGRHLVDEGEYSYQFFAIEEGTADVLREGEKVTELGPGDFFGEIGLLEKTLRTASVVSTSPMRLITLTNWDLKRALKAMPGLREKLESAVAARTES